MLQQHFRTNWIWPEMLQQRIGTNLIWPEMLQQQIRTNWVSQNDTNRWRSLQMCGKWKFHDLTYTADAIMSLCYFEFVNPKWYKNKTLKIAGYFLQKTESETSCNISGQNHFVLICCCNISGQIQFVLKCCCNISGQTEKTCYFWGNSMFFVHFNWSWSPSCI